MSERKLTRNQQLVLDRLAASGSALTAYDLLDQLRGEGLRAPVQVYRALETLGQRGLIHRIESMNAFIACCAHDHQAAAGFAICDDCGEVAEFAFPASEEGLRSEVGKAGFETRHMTVELHGRCAACAGR
ncbi:transcriptional repressor [Pelagibius litoralis]|uniref:Transcriptional repressor n=1 Tax=Pelagibius litoralis TaxID=374515 RepID=A0A967EYY5_9PROT|nr:Fur family transcriptional regulator [Pelagibius litoralis]NIA70000.1 transcriptional repressor [Pelagibius litoralis]